MTAGTKPEHDAGLAPSGSRWHTAWRMATNSTAKQNGGANLGFVATLWAAADKMQNNLDAAEYKHVVLGLPKLLSDAVRVKQEAKV